MTSTVVTVLTYSSVKTVAVYVGLVRVPLADRVRASVAVDRMPGRINTRNTVIRYLSIRSNDGICISRRPALAPGAPLAQDKPQNPEVALADSPA